MKILLADDDTKIHLIVKMWLGKNGHDVDSAYNGQEALEKLTNSDYECLITDVNMPLMKGFELVNAVDNLPNKPELIVMLTSRCDVKELEQQVKDVGVHLFNKPFSPAVLADLIENLANTTRGSMAT